ncbi:hypothetical protein [Apilactobacillus quenuiae]|uniref:hypothetical protein n=1 Tax=Apilactobacillus quenuiae TaxID=2008377 RepID=UPI000D02072F|nr:hypothetical protein [Apilactobacillus quenuiae]
MTKFLWGRMVMIRLFLKNGKKIEFLAVHTQKSFSINFTVPFGDSSTAHTSTVTIMNVSKAHRDMFKKGLKVQVFAGYKQDNGLKLIAEGAIDKINPLSASGADTQFSFTFVEGQQLLQAQSTVEKENAKLKSNAKKREKVLGKTDAKKFKVKLHTAMSFAPGANSNVIIRRVAADANIKISKLKLPKVKTFKKGYVAKGKPYKIIHDLAKTSGAQVYDRRGQLVIEDETSLSGKNEHILISMATKGKPGGTGLMEHVSFDDSTDSHATISVKTYLRNQISTGSLVTIKDPPYFTGTRRVQSGEFNCGDGDFSTTIEVYQNAKSK